VYDNIVFIHRYKHGEFKHSKKPYLILNVWNIKKWTEDALWNNDQIKLGICVKENDELIGFCLLIKIALVNGSTEISIMIGNNNYWGKGLGSEAILLLSDFAFNERGYNRIWARILESNIASKKMFEKCGYITEGLLRQSIYKNGKFQNQVIMSIFQEEFYQMLKEKGIA